MDVLLSATGTRLVSMNGSSGGIGDAFETMDVRLTTTETQLRSMDTLFGLIDGPIKSMDVSFWAIDVSSASLHVHLA
jgi:hypothetical protein